MPEIKHHFRAGKMNKDLDERLVPNGEYRDALNVEIATSDGDDVGALQTVLGNNREDVREYSDGVYATIAARMNSAWTTNGKCVGSCLDTNNDKAYYFVADTNYGGIFEFEQKNPEITSIKSGIIKPVLIDKNNVLKFSSSNRITGINVIDGILFWTDNISEPKKINIEKFKGYTADDPTTHTQIDGSNFAEEHVTVIRKNPKLAPNLTMSTSKRPLPVEATINYKFTQSGGGNPPYPPGTERYDLIFTPNPNWEVGNTIKATHTDAEGDEIEVRFTILDRTLPISAVDYLFDITIDSVQEDTPTSAVDWECQLVQEKPLFEFKFPRFSYRYKYDDGEYSCFAPWSETVFLPENFDYNPKKGYNLGMVNNIRSLKVKNFIKDSSGASTLPWDVVEVDVLYKESNSNNVYTVKTIRKVGPGNVPDPEWSNDEIEITSDIIHKVVSPNQLLRPWDNVPLKALAQELTANRLMYANYTENFNMLDYNDEEITANFKWNIAHNIDLTKEPGEPGKSIKSIRTYQLGVVYRDKYGRETPVFTGNTSPDVDSVTQIVTGSAITLPKVAALDYNCISVKLTNNPPKFANSYKFYIKETASEYYNLALDRWYDSQDGNIWLSFSSSDRNKVDEETYLILKKQHDNDVFVEQEARYKIIAIENKAPDFIKKTRSIKGVIRSGTVKYDTRGFRGRSKGSVADFDGTAGPFYSTSATPQSNRNYCDIPKPLWDKAGLTSDSFELHILPDLQFRIRSASKRSSWYDVKGMSLFNEAVDDASNFWRVEVKGRFETDTDWALDADGDQASGMWVEFAQKETRTSPEFQGRFFVKVYRDNVLTQNLLSESRSEDQWDITYAPMDTFRSEATMGLDNSSNWGNASSIWYADTCRYYESTAPSCRHAKVSSFSNGEVDFGYDTTGQYQRTMEYNGHWTKNDGLRNAGHGFLAGSKFVSIAYNKFGPDKISDNSHAWDKVYRDFEHEHHPEFQEFFNRLGTVGSIFKMSKDTGNGGEPYEYTIMAFSRCHFTAWHSGGCANQRAKHDSSRVIRWSLYLDKEIKSSTNTAFGTDGNEMVFIEKYFAEDERGDFTSENPAIFETEPKENIELDIYHEASDAYDITNPGTATAAHSTSYHKLDWFNCFSFNNGVESNRIRDDYNAITIDKGPRVSAVFAEQYKEEQKTNDIIYSGVFNSRSGVNRTNQFIQGEKITKSLNPRFGDIQKLHARNTDLIALCEDKVLNIPCNKDILFNADGNPNVTASNKVLGTAQPYVGEYGISKDPASFASYGYMAYFTDKNRGTVIRMERNGLIPIANYGMTDYFKDKMRDAVDIVGSYDDNRDLYNLTIKTDETSGSCTSSGSNNVTISFSEMTKGWTSFKSFIQEEGFSLNNKYYTFKEGDMWLHHNNQTRNKFYDDQHQSEVVLLLNDSPSTIKSFNTLNYEGSQANVTVNSAGTNVLNPDGINQDIYYNNTAKVGWYCDYIKTDQTLSGQEGKVPEFLDKENKWFNYIQGEETTLNNLDQNEFSVQGIGQITTGGSGSSGTNYTLTITQSQL